MNKWVNDFRLKWYIVFLLFLVLFASFSIFNFPPTFAGRVSCDLFARNSLGGVGRGRVMFDGLGLGSFSMRVWTRKSSIPSSHRESTRCYIINAHEIKRPPSLQKSDRYQVSIRQSLTAKIPSDDKKW